VNAPTFFSSSLFVALGGGIGAWLRYVTGRLWLAGIGPVAASAFPWATLTANVLGSLAMGLLVGWLARHGELGFGGGETWRLLLGVGLLGGFTTFSAFSLELANFIVRGALAHAAFYALVSVCAGILGLLAGLSIMRSAG
jgi:fluoride exporter